MTITINGDTGIAGVDGTASVPAVQGNDTNTGLFYPAADTVGISTGGSERMRVDSSGNVGIGTTSPSYKLDVQQNGNLNASIGVSNTTAGTSSLARLVAVSDGGSAIFGFTSSSYTDITGAADALLLNANNASGGMAFALDGVVKMKMDSSGNVGIGTSSPNSKLGFAIGNNTVIGQSASSAHQAGNAGYLGLGVNDGGGYSGVFVYNTFGGTYSSQDIRFLTAQGGVSVATERMRIDSSGILMLGTTSTNPVSSRVNGFIVTPGFGINLRGASQTCAFGLSSSSGTNIGFYTDNGSSAVSAGNISSNGSTTAFNTSSDYRLKENVLDLLGGVETIQKLRPVSYTWKEGYGNGAGEGFIAHELAEHIPLAVTGEKDAVDEEGNIKPQGVDYSKIVVHLVAAVQELSAKVDAQAAEIAALKATR